MDGEFNIFIERFNIYSGCYFLHQLNKLTNHSSYIVFFFSTSQFYFDLLLLTHVKSNSNFICLKVCYFVIEEDGKTKCIIKGIIKKI